MPNTHNWAMSIQVFGILLFPVFYVYIRIHNIIQINGRSNKKSRLLKMKNAIIYTMKL